MPALPTAIVAMSLAAIACCLFALATFGFWQQQRAGSAENPPPLLAQYGLAIASVAVLLEAIALLLIVIQNAGLQLSVTTMAALVMWTATLVLLLLWRKALGSLAVLMLPFSTIACALLLIPKPNPLLIQGGIGLQLHILLSVLAYGMLIVAATQAVLLAIQERHLRRRSSSKTLLANLPALTDMETWLFQLIGIGFALLSLSLGSGAVYVDDLFSQHLAHKVVFSVAAWLVFCALLWGRWQFGWRGRRAINFTLLGCTLLALGYFGAKLVLEWVLGTHWG